VTEPQPSPSRHTAELAARLLLQRQGEHLVILHVGPLVSYADYFLIISGRSARHVQSLADHLEQEMAKQGLRPLGVEGKTEGTWVLLDYNDVIVHVFHDPVRLFYDLEGLWTDAPRIEPPEVPEEAQQPPPPEP
jgi:ribosome-associated protein